LNSIGSNGQLNNTKTFSNANLEKDNEDE